MNNHPPLVLDLIKHLSPAIFTIIGFTLSYTLAKHLK